MLRAGPFSEERIVRLANRRFVPFFFDLDDGGAVGDADARTFVVKARPELAGGAIGTPPVLFMTPDGEVLGEVPNEASENKVHAAMLRVLKEHPDWAKSSPAEEKLGGVARAEFLVDLWDLDAAKAALGPAADAKSAYALGRILRFQGEFDQADKAFARVDDASLAPDVRLERAYRHWAARDPAKLSEALKDFPKDSRRWTEARYLEGLARFHAGEAEAACAIWKATIAAAPQDPWIYRADWAYCGVMEKETEEFRAGRDGASRLKRIGYMGRRNPDLRKK